uniref:Uncharacterized protein n=1 Tax=Rhizophagus irregularis (strain DAOM 181602 / DAOM 197198 / MUCL 43194) TaxID=747089 RepID=U9TZW3_RHIID
MYHQCPYYMWLFGHQCPFNYGGYLNTQCPFNYGGYLDINYGTVGTVRNFGK